MAIGKVWTASGLVEVGIGCVDTTEAVCLHQQFAAPQPSADPQALHGTARESPPLSRVTERRRLLRMVGMSQSLHYRQRPLPPGRASNKAQ